VAMRKMMQAAPIFALGTILLICACSQQPEASDLLTIDRIKVGATDPSGILSIRSNATGQCPEGELEIEGVGTAELVSSRSKSGACAVIAYRIVRMINRVTGPTGGRKELLAFDLFKMKPNDVLAKLGRRHLISRENIAAGAVAYCYPY